MNDPLTAAVITVSDRAAKGIYRDDTGPSIVKLLNDNGWKIGYSTTIPDDELQIQSELIKCCDQMEFHLVVTAGGTGLSPRDVTPEATRAVIQKETPGIVQAMMQASLLKTPHAMLSRQVAGIRSRTLIINLPGSPKAAFENLEVVLPALQHAISLIRSDPDA